MLTTYLGLGTQPWIPGVQAVLHHGAGPPEATWPAVNIMKPTQLRQGKGRGSRDSKVRACRKGSRARRGLLGPLGLTFPSDESLGEKYHRTGWGPGCPGICSGQEQERPRIETTSFEGVQK